MAQRYHCSDGEIRNMEEIGLLLSHGRIVSIVRKVRLDIKKKRGLYVLSRRWSDVLYFPEKLTGGGWVET